MLAGRTPVIYSNRLRRDTKGKDSVHVAGYTLYNSKGTQLSIHAPRVPAALARRIREGAFTRIDVSLES